MTHAKDDLESRQEAQDLLVHIEELLAEVDDPATANEAVARLTSVVTFLNGVVGPRRQPADETAPIGSKTYKVTITREQFQDHGDCWVARDEQDEWRSYAKAHVAETPVAAAKAMFHADEIARVIDHGKFAVAVIAIS